MKKIKFFAMIGLSAIVSLSSCTEEAAVVSSPVVVAAKDSAVITGYATAELNQQSAGDEAVPAGSTILVSIPYSQLNSSATGTWLRTITVASDGKYTVKVPTNNTGVIVSIIPSIFEYEQTQSYVSGATLPKVKLTYAATKSTVTVISGQVIRKDINYSTTTDLPIGYPKVSITGKVQAEIDASIIGLENLPDGTKIIFTASGWADSTTVTAGKYTILVPQGLAVRWTISKALMTKVWNPSLTNPALSSYIDVNKTFTIANTNTFTTSISTCDITPSGALVSTETPVSSVLSGSLRADLDLTQNGLESLPNGTKIYFYTDNWGATASVTNGGFNVSVPAQTAINYYVSTATNHTSSNNFQSIHTFAANGTIYSGSGVTFNITATDPINYTTISIGAKADLDLTISGNEYLPIGTKVTFTSTTPAWSDVVTISTLGSFTLSAPTYASVSYSINTTAQQKQTNGSTISKTFQISGTFNTSNTYNLSITAIAN